MGQVSFIQEVVMSEKKVMTVAEIHAANVAAMTETEPKKSEAKK